LTGTLSAGKQTHISGIACSTKVVQRKHKSAKAVKALIFIDGWYGFFSIAPYWTIASFANCSSTILSLPIVKITIV